MQDINTDRPECIRIYYTMKPRLVTDPEPRCGNREDFIN